MCYCISFFTHRSYGCLPSCLTKVVLVCSYFIKVQILYKVSSGFGERQSTCQNQVAFWNSGKRCDIETNLQNSRLSSFVVVINPIPALRQLIYFHHCYYILTYVGYKKSVVIKFVFVIICDFVYYIRWHCMALHARLDFKRQLCFLHRLFCESSFTLKLLPTIWTRPACNCRGL